MRFPSESRDAAMNSALDILEKIARGIINRRCEFAPFLTRTIDVIMLVFNGFKVFIFFAV